MPEVILQNIEIFTFFILLILGYMFGRWAEKKHYQSIFQREEKWQNIAAIASRFPPEDKLYRQELVIGVVVISDDYFKRFVAGFRNVFGGSVTGYETLLDRARREAVLRMKQEALKKQARYIFNIKYETSFHSVGSVEMLAYGTALTPK